MSAASRRGPLFWGSAAAGWALILWGVRGALHHDLHTRPGQLARFLLGGALAHDLLLAPGVLLAGALVARAVHGRWRAPVQAALIISGMVALFAFPLVRGYGRAHHNPTSLPHDYAANLVVVLALVVAGTALAALISASRRPGGGWSAPWLRPYNASSGFRRRPTRWPGSRPRPPGPDRWCGNPRRSSRR